ncbi:hypothetical protein IMSAG249_02445 [Lachnospiraceae bacterium]|nr:hypothetical protein IMSAGC009_04618 [Lachnospiraceae bacterium]GFI70616.1 hypothetical protein IMSAG249_02445 [Lachnospiraceae bacterium]
MKPRMKKNRVLPLTVGVMLVFLLFTKSACGAGAAAVMGMSKGDAEIIIFVKGVEDGGEQLSVQIGTSACEDVSVRRIDEEPVPMRTLIMVDNSVSIPEKAREQIIEILQNLIADRLGGEETALAVFGEDITWLTDYTSDYTALKSAVENMDYQDQETYLTDVLYELLSAEYTSNPQNVYRRIIVISDGVDNKSIGYTKEELYTLLREVLVPVYSIGTETGKNNEQLENMFAISRITGADSFLLGELESLLDINSALNEDRNILEVKLKPEAEFLDGTRKSVRLSFESGQSLAVEISMPQQENIEKLPEETIQPEPAKQPEIVETAAQPSEESARQGNGFVKSAIILVAVLLAGSGVVLGVVFFCKRKKRERTFEPITEDILLDLKKADDPEDEKTEIIGAAGRESGGDTFLIWNSDDSYSIVLTDMDSPSRTFQMPLNNSVLIGRGKGECDIVIDHDSNKTVSRKHCRIDVKNGCFFVTDLQSGNGTYVNGSKILSETEIFSGNILKLGNVKLKFEVH